jgi:hypothetical protein
LPQLGCGVGLQFLPKTPASSPISFQPSGLVRGQRRGLVRLSQAMVFCGERPGVASLNLAGVLPFTGGFQPLLGGWFSAGNSVAKRQVWQVKLGINVKGAGAMRQQMDWSPEQIAKLESLVAKALSAAQIGAILGCSRNAVIGICGRRGIALMLKPSHAGVTGKRPFSKPSLGQVKAVQEALERGEKIPRVAEALGLACRAVKTISSAMGRQTKRPKQMGEDAGLRQRLANKINTPLPETSAMAERFKEGYGGQLGRLALAELTEASCKFPIEQEIGPDRYCGLAAVAGQSWCAAHFERCRGGVVKQGRPFRLPPMSSIKIGMVA